MPPILRLAGLKDSATLARMRWDFKAEEDGLTDGQSAFERAFAVWFPEALASGRWHPWLAEVDGRIVAHAYVYRVPKVPSPTAPTDCWGYITAVYTVPEARNSGVGAALLRHLLAWAESERLELLLLWPSERSVPFYRRLGFDPSPEALELLLVPED